MKTTQQILREALAELPAGLAWPPNRSPGREEIFTPPRQRNVLDVTRTLVVGNRGVGKTFWSHALAAPAGREVAAAAYNLPLLRKIDAAFGFKGDLADDIAPSSTVLGTALGRVNDAIIVWLAILLRSYGQSATAGLPRSLEDLSAWFSENPEDGERRIRSADAARAAKGRPLLVLFDALDTLARDWADIRQRTEGLLRLAVLAKGLSATHVKVFMRPDQFADASLFRFPDASKLRAERVDLLWGFNDLYALMFFHLARNQTTRLALKAFVGRDELFPDEYPHLSDFVLSEPMQRVLFEKVAGKWMGKDKKRGATYSWLVQHLADARSETTPRGFLTALSAAARRDVENPDLVVDYRGIQIGVSEASENRVDDLRQDYWWIDYVSGPLAGLETPLDRERLFEAWRMAGTATAIRNAASKRGLLPVFLALRSSKNHLLRDEVAQFATDEAALLESLRLIAVFEIRTNGKVNVPDIFRVAFKMKRRGGVPPKRPSRE